MKWELVAEHTPGGMDNSTYRMPIPEGWLYRYGGQLVFVPTPVISLTSTSVNPHVSNTFGTTKYL